MPDEQKTVFISYRRSVAWSLSRLVFNDLTEHGYDVFMDVESINNGTFDTIIRNQIEARAHFVLILTPGTVERCAEPDDWLRREIEYAFDNKRNVVPLLVNNFTFKETERYLTGKLADLPRFNGITIPPDYFDAAMEKLRNRFLKQIDGVIVPTPASDKAIVEQKIQAATHEANAVSRVQQIIDRVNKHPLPKSPSIVDQINASIGWYIAYITWKVLPKLDVEKKISTMTEILSVNPQHIGAYHHRGDARQSKGDIYGAIADYSEGIRINRQERALYNNRAIARFTAGDIDGAIADYSEAIHLDPHLALAYNNRGHAYQIKGDKDNAISDFTEAIHLNSKYVNPYYNRGVSYFVSNQFDNAFRDFQRAYSLNTTTRTSAGIAIAYYALGQKSEAKTIWRKLVAEDGHYLDADWVSKELNWTQPLVEAARKLIAEL